MSLYTLIIVTFVIFMAINVIIGLRGRKHASTTKDFLTASGQSGIWFIIASAVGASIGSGVVIGTTQYAVKLGVAGAWYAIACGLACVVHAFVMTRFIYRNKLVSFSDYFKRRYDSNFIILLYSGIGPFACAASMGGQLVAAKAIFQAFGIEAFAEPLLAIGVVLGGVLRGAGDTRWPFVISLLGMWVVRLPLAYTLIHLFDWGLAAVWGAAIADWAVRAAISCHRFYHKKWMTQKV